MTIGIVGGSGLVGKEIIKLLPKVKIFSRSRKYDFKGLETVFLCTPSHISLELAPLAIGSGARVIDLSSAFRKDPSVPLILPEINLHTLDKNSALIACPNCIVAILLMVLGPLHKAFKITHMQIVTFQAASGAGKEGLLEFLENRPPNIFPHSLNNNLFIHESLMLETGYTEEEDKIIFETKKILNSPEIGVNVRSIRVPVLRAHSMAVNVTFNTAPINANEILDKAKGVLFHPSPTPKIGENRHEVFYGPIRKDLSRKNTLDLWITGDQLIRGSALTAVEIANQITI